MTTVTPCAHWSRQPALFARTRPFSPRRSTSSLKRARTSADPLAEQQPRGASGGRTFSQTKMWWSKRAMLVLFSPRLVGERALQQLARDDQPLDLARPLVDAERPHLAVDALHDRADDDALPAVDLDGAVDDAARRLGRLELGERRSGAGALEAGVVGLRRAAGRLGERVEEPRRAAHREARELEIGEAVGEVGLQELEVGERLAELAAGACMAARLAERARRQPDRRRADARAEAVERRERQREAFAFGADALARRHAAA